MVEESSHRLSPDARVPSLIAGVGLGDVQLSAPIDQVNDGYVIRLRRLMPTADR